MYDHAVLHYAEIGTKSGNRAFFERTLARNVERVLRLYAAPPARLRVRRETGRLVFALADVPEVRQPQALAAVARQPGIAWVSAACRTEPTLAALGAKLAEVARRHSGSFKVNARRSDKSLPFDSMDMNRELGAAVVLATGRPVDVHRPDVEYRVEVDTRAGYVHDARLPGPGGLPVGTAGRVVSLLSGGIDSPVASYRMMLRGAEVVGLHMWNRSWSGEGVREKLLDLGRALAQHQGRFELHLVPFEQLQQEIVAAAPDRVRMLLYRRAMLHVADALRRETGAEATVLGDSVGQVASQTLSNLAAVYDAALPPVLAPLCGTDKLDIVRTAQRIGTYEVSVRPADDCCGLLVARHPATRSRVADLREVESRYALPELVAAALAARETHVLSAVA
jgi:tRNA uracil 4-sulfurtransferase